MKQIFMLVTYGVILFIAGMNLDDIILFLQKILGVFLPLGLGFLLAFVLAVPMNGFEKIIRSASAGNGLRLKDKTIHIFSLLLTFTSIILVFIVVCTIAIPEIVASVKSIGIAMAEKWPEWIKILNSYDIDTAPIAEWLENVDFEHLFTKFASNAGDLVNVLAGTAVSTVSGIATGTIAIVIMFYVLLSKNDLARQGRMFLYANCKKEIADRIANRLNELGVLSPFEYKISSGSHYETGFRQKEQALWSSVTVRRILENEVYIGNLVQGKRTTPNHKVKQSYVKPEDDWIRIEKNHEPLVSERDFEIVQRLLGMDTRTSPDQKQVYLLSGIAVCADCGAPMTRKVSTVGGKKYAYYLCSTNKETKRCSSHRIPEKDLENVVLVMLKQHIQNILHLKRVLEFIGTVPFQEINVKKLQDRLEKKKMETERCKELRMMLYSDMKEGIVSKEDYVELHAAYGKRLRNAEESIRAIQKEMDNMLEKADASNTWLDYFVKYQDIEVLTRTVIVELIREIRVHDKKNIEIVFDFDDCYQALLTQLPAMGVEVATDPDNNLQVKIKEVV